ncbi:unnamed protein product [Schistosoma turkestanicum]|nr:unnamed protein product [Schistosoma turkestanicum]
MPIFNHCPIQAKDYCQNGGECFYLSGDPSIYMCSCFMPFYGPQCEHKAPSRDKQVEVEEIQKNFNINNDHVDNDGFIIKRSVDRAMTLTALIFIVVTFLGMLILAWYISRRRRKDYARWRRMTELAMKSNTKEKSDKQTQITLDYADEKEISSLIKSTHSLDNNSHDDNDDDADDDGDDDLELNNDKKDLEAQFELTKTSSVYNDHYEKQTDKYSDIKLKTDEDELSVHSNSNIMETMKSVGKPDTYNQNIVNQSNSVIGATESSNNNDNNNQIEFNQKKRTKSKRMAPTPPSHNVSLQSVHNHNPLLDASNDNPIIIEQCTDLNEETKDLDTNIINNPNTTQLLKNANLTTPHTVVVDRYFDPPKLSSIENQQYLNKSYDHIISNNTIGGRKLSNPKQPPIANILSSVILDRPYINADEIHTLFDQNAPNSTRNPCHDLEYYNPINTKISSTLRRDYKHEVYSSNVKNRDSNNSIDNNNNNNMNSVNIDQSLHCLISEHKGSKLFYGPQEPFTVASQHDALLSELLHRGMHSNPGESRPKSTF